MIKEMTINDYQEVYELWLTCKGMALNNIDDSKEGIERFLLRNPKTCLVDIEDQKIVGVILVGNDGRRGYIYHLVVHQDYRRQHIATNLVQYALNRLQQLKISKVALLVFSNNKEANLFWKQLGFTSRKDIEYRNKEIVELIRHDT